VRQVRESADSTEAALFNESQREVIARNATKQRVLMWKHWDAVHEWLVRPNPDLFPTKLFTPVAWEWAWSMAQTRTWGGNPPEWLLNLVSDAGKVRCGGGRARARASEGDVC